jgi:hypothetical protein
MSKLYLNQCLGCDKRSNALEEAIAALLAAITTRKMPFPITT